MNVAGTPNIIVTRSGVKRGEHPARVEAALQHDGRARLHRRVQNRVLPEAVIERQEQQQPILGRDPRDTAASTSSRT